MYSKIPNTEDDQSSMEQVENAKGDCLEKGHKGQLNSLLNYYAKGRLKTTYTNYILLRHFSSRRKLCSSLQFELLRTLKLALTLTLALQFLL